MFVLCHINCDNRETQAENCCYFGHFTSSKKKDQSLTDLNILFHCWTEFVD